MSLGLITISLSSLSPSLFLHDPLFISWRYPHSMHADEYLKYSFYPYALVSFSSVFMLNNFPNALKVHTYDQVIHLMELCKIGGKLLQKQVLYFDIFRYHMSSN